MITHSASDPFAIADAIRDKLFWRPHDIFVIDEVAGSYAKWKWSYTWAQQARPSSPPAARHRCLHCAS